MEAEHCGVLVVVSHCCVAKFTRRHCWVNKKGSCMAEKPIDVIVIFTDDQGYGDASCLNSDAKCFRRQIWIG